MLLKQALKGTYYISVEPFHVRRYLDESSYRYNTPKGTDSEQSTEALDQLGDRRVTYKQSPEKV